MKKIISTVFALALGLASMSLAAEDKWSTKANMLTARYVPSSGVVDGKIYAIGGVRDSRAVSAVEEYDPAMDTWTRKANMPTAAGGAGTSVVNGRIYVIGGGSVLNEPLFSSVQEYDAATDKWTIKASMPAIRCWVSSSVVNGKIYAIGGAVIAYGTPLSTVEEYDPATDTWTRKADMPTARACLSSSVVNGKIYAIGGTLSDPYYRGLTTVEEYNPVTDTWTRKADMPTGRTYISTCALNGRIYAVGGVKSGEASHVAPVEEYDPVTDTWTGKADMLTARSGVSTSVINSKIYAIGGWVGSGSAISTVEEYDPYPLVVDLNGDYQIDIEDLILLIEHWGQDEPVFDIAPPPFGDGIIDVQDLELLMDYWGQDVDHSLLVHWELDEAEGEVAHDSLNKSDAVVIGDAVWLSEGGQIEGAIQFDGINTYLEAPHILNPADGVFSAFAWVKGGAPGQVILSQEEGANWLMLDAQGNLKTSLKGGTRLPDLNSGVMLSDDTWHRVGFVWDGESRVLYIDDIEVASDPHAGLDESNGGMYIGAGSGLDAGTFFSGLIDDVRIYDRVVEP